MTRLALLASLSLLASCIVVHEGDDDDDGGDDDTSTGDIPGTSAS